LGYDWSQIGRAEAAECLVVYPEYRRQAAGTNATNALEGEKQIFGRLVDFNAQFAG
jgi:hypothetical protein